jgi:hypothetical protein
MDRDIVLKDGKIGREVSEKESRGIARNYKVAHVTLADITSQHLQTSSPPKVSITQTTPHYFIREAAHSLQRQCILKNSLRMANYLASIFGTEQDKVNVLAISQICAHQLTQLYRSTARSTTRLEHAVTAIGARANMSSHPTRRPSSFRTSTRTQPMTPRTR